MKRCTKCGIVKPIDEFYKNKRCVDGKHPSCKGCVKESNKEQYKKNIGKVKEVGRKWREDNPERIKERSKKYYEENIDKVREVGRKWTKNNPEKARAIRERYYKNNSKTIKKRCKKYYNDYTEKVTETHKKYAASDAGKTSIAKCQAKRKRNFGYVPLNKHFTGCHGHHITPRYVIHIPAKMHKSITHRQGDVKSMYKINGIAIDFLNEQRK